jgi:hypothetical protein
MPCLKVALTAVGNQVTIHLALQNLTRTETHHQYLNLLMLTLDSLPSADLKSLQTYPGPLSCSSKSQQTLYLGINEACI